MDEDDEHEFVCANEAGELEHSVTHACMHVAVCRHKCMASRSMKCSNYDHVGIGLAVTVVDCLQNLREI